MILLHSKTLAICSFLGVLNFKKHLRVYVATGGNPWFFFRVWQNSFGHSVPFYISIVIANLLPHIFVKIDKYYGIFLKVFAHISNNKFFTLKFQVWLLQLLPYPVISPVSLRFLICIENKFFATSIKVSRLDVDNLHFPCLETSVTT